MARRGFGGTALRAALGAVTGVAEGLQQRDVVAAEKKRMADAAALDQARFLISSGFRVAPDAYDTEDPAARSVLPPLEMPSAAPPSATRASGALSAALNRGMGVDPTQMSMSNRSFGADPLAMDGGGSRMTEMFERAKQTRPAQEAIAASVNLGGGQKVRFNAPESASAKAQREYEDAMRTERGKLALSATQDVQKQKELESKFVTDVAKLVKTGVPEAQAVQTLMLKGTYGDLFMSPAEKARNLLDRQNFNLAQDQFEFDKTGGKTPVDAQRKAGTNLMLNANKRMLDFENKVDSGELRITVKDQILRKLATDFGNEKTPFAKILSSGAYKELAETNKEFAEYIRNIDGFAEGETATVGRPSNYRTQMAKFLSGIAAGSPSEVIRRVQERRAGFMAPYVDQFYGGDMKKAELEAVGSFRTPDAPPATIDQWMDANPQRAGEGESDKAYMARARTSMEGK